MAFRWREDLEAAATEANSSSSGTRPVGGMDLAGLLPHFRVLSPVLRALIPQPPNVIDTLRARLLAIEVAKAGIGASVPVLERAFSDLPGHRQDWIISGMRGSGKTATAVAVAQKLGAAQKLPMLGFRWPERIARQVGFAVCDDLQKARDCVVVIDEAGIHAASGKARSGLWSVLALARHRNVSLLWTVQDAAALHRDVLRVEAIWAFKTLDPQSTQFGREELGDQLAQAVAIQSAPWWSSSHVLLRADGRWVVTAHGLPAGWSEGVSVLWR